MITQGEFIFFWSTGPPQPAHFLHPSLQQSKHRGCGQPSGGPSQSDHFGVRADEGMPGLDGLQSGPCQARLPAEEGRAGGMSWGGRGGSGGVEGHPADVGGDQPQQQQPYSPTCGQPWTVCPPGEVGAGQLDVHAVYGQVDKDIQRYRDVLWHQGIKGNISSDKCVSYPTHWIFVLFLPLNSRSVQSILSP